MLVRYASATLMRAVPDAAATNAEMQISATMKLQTEHVLATPTRTGTYVKIQAAPALFLNAFVLVVVPAYAAVAAS